MSKKTLGRRTVGIRTNDETVLARIPPLLPPAWHPSESPIVDTLFSLRVGPPTTRKGQRNYHLLYSGTTRVARTFDLEEVFRLLESHIHITVGYWAKADHLFVHAGVVGWRGKAIVMPGRSHVGKTTLVSALIRAGASYYSDDMAVFDPQGWVHPYPVPLSVREPDGPCKYAPEAFDSTAGEEPLPVGLVVMTRFQSGGRWQPRPLSSGRALMALLDNTLAARKEPTVSLPILRQVALSAPAIRSVRGEAAEVVQPVLAAVQTGQ